MIMDCFLLSLQVKAAESSDGVEEGYESSRDEVLSVSSYNPMKEDLSRTFGSSLSLQSFSGRSSNRGSLYAEGRASIASNAGPPRLSVAEVSNDPASGKCSLSHLYFYCLLLCMLMILMDILNLILQPPITNSELLPV